MDFIPALAAGFGSIAGGAVVEPPEHVTSPSPSLEEEAWRALFESDARFREVFDGGMVEMCVRGLQLRVLNANAAFQEIAGMHLDDIVGAFAGPVLVPAGGERRAAAQGFHGTGSGMSRTGTSTGSRPRPGSSATTAPSSGPVFPRHWCARGMRGLTT